MPKTKIWERIDTVFKQGEEVRLYSVLITLK